MSRPSDDALWTSVQSTLVDVVLPALDDPWARAAAVQLAGLAAYARRRGEDPVTRRHDELRAALDGLAGNDLVAGHWPGEDPVAAAAAVLAAAVTDGGPAASEARDRLRPILVRHLDEDLASSEVLLGPFRGRPPDA